MRTQPAAVAAIGALLLLAGLVRVGGYVVPWMVGERRLDVGAQQVAAVEMDQDRRLVEAQRNGLTRASIEQLRAQYTKEQQQLLRLQVARAKANSASFLRIVGTADVLLALSGILVGVALLQGIAWARRAAVWQAVAAIMVGLSWMTVAPNLSIEWRLLETLLTAGGQAAPGWLHSMGWLTLSRWGGAFWLLASNGFIMWYLTRDDVRGTGA